MGRRNDLRCSFCDYRTPEYKGFAAPITQATAETLLEDHLDVCSIKQEEEETQRAEREGFRRRVRENFSEEQAEIILEILDRVEP